MAKITVSVLKCRHPRYRFTVVMSREGRRLRQRYLKTKGEADAVAQAFKTEVANAGAQAAASISDLDRMLVVEARTKLQPYGKTLRDAFNFFLAHLERTIKPCTVADAVDSLLTLKGKEGRSRVYQADLQNRLGCFCADFGDRQISEITTAEISDWLARLNLSPVSVANYRRVLSLLFNRAVAGGFIDRNPVLFALKPKITETEIGILTPTEAERLLRAAHSDILPVIAIGLFAGLRTAELQRIDWRDIDLEGGHIEVKATKAKSARRRLIKIQPCLSAWITPLAKPAGSVWPEQRERGRNLLDDAKRAAGFGTPGSETPEEKARRTKLRPWPSNGMRHSFASYHLAQFKDSGELALEMGHTNSAILFQHYRELVKPKAAESFWSIMPDVSSKIIPLAEAV